MIMDTQEQIDLIIDRQYNNFKGRLMQPLKEIHQKARELAGDDSYLEFLKKSEIENPRPIFEIPDNLKELKFKKPKERSNKNSRYTLPNGANEIKMWKPNVFQRFMYWTGILKDPRYNGKEVDWLLDEEGQMPRKYLQATKYENNKFKIKNRRRNNDRKKD